MKLSGQKFAAICRKYNLPKYETTGFSLNSYSQEISYNSGRNRLSLRKELDLFVLMANALMNEGFDVFYGQQSYNKSPIFKMELFGNVFEYRSADVFRNAFEEFCVEDDIRKQEELNRQNQKNAERERVWNKKIEIAKEINPNINIQVLQKIDENHYICYTQMDTPNGVVYIQFAAEKKSHWGDESLKWYLKLQPLQFINDRFDGGSTNVDGCDTIEDGLIDYVATWHVYLQE